MLEVCVFTFLIIGAVQAVPAPGHGALAGYCNTGDHCDVDECCVSFNQPRGKRVVVDTLDPDLMRFVDGHCQKLGTNGSICFVDELSTGKDGLYYDCPCSSGFECVPTGEFALAKGPPGFCEVAVSRTESKTLNQACTSGDDCSDTECCVSDNRPIGKRQAYAHCQAMGATAAGCLVRYGSGKPNGTVFQCPCLSGLTCHGDGVYDVPLGEVGTCGA